MIGMSVILKLFLQLLKSLMLQLLYIKNEEEEEELNQVLKAM